MNIVIENIEVPQQDDIDGTNFLYLGVNCDLIFERIDGGDDYDSIADATDDRSLIANTDQPDTDSDAAGEVYNDDDNDVLSDTEELELGTDPLKADTDGDGLNDAEEASLAAIPLNPDTDNDGISDGDEVATGKNLSVNEGAVIQIFKSILLEDDQKYGQIPVKKLT